MCAPERRNVARHHTVGVITAASGIVREKESDAIYICGPNNWPGLIEQRRTVFGREAEKNK